MERRLLVMVQVSLWDDAVDQTLDLGEVHGPDRADLMQVERASFTRMLADKHFRVK
jgi:hypothetical protein